VFRTIKNILNESSANSIDQSDLTIEKIEMIKLSEQQMDLIYKHDIDNDDQLSRGEKLRSKEDYYNLFLNKQH